VAAKGGDFGTTLGNILIPQTMAGLQNYGLKEKAIEQQQTQESALGALLRGLQSGQSGGPQMPMIAQQKLAALADPETAKARAIVSVFPEPPKIMTKKDDESIVSMGPGGSNLQTIAPSIAKPAPKADLVTIKPVAGPTRSYNAATQQDEIEAALKSGGVEVREPSTRVDVNMTPQTKALTELSSNALSEGRTNAMSSFESLYSLGRMKQALDDGLKPGALAPAQETVSNVLVGLGVDPNTVNQFYNAKASADYDAASKELTRSVIKAFGANPSNSDRDFAEKMAPQLKTNPQAAPFLIARIEAKHKGNIESYRSMLKGRQSDPNAGIALAELGAKQNQYDALLKDLNAGPPKIPGAPTAPKPMANVIQSLPPDAVRQADGTYTSPSYPGKIIRPQ